MRRSGAGLTEGVELFRGDTTHGSLKAEREVDWKIGVAFGFIFAMLALIAFILAVSVDIHADAPLATESAEESAPETTEEPAEDPTEPTPEEPIEEPVEPTAESLNPVGVLASQDRLRLPLVWSVEEGAYMVRLHMGANPVELVLDSGSSHLSVKGADCRYRQCGSEQLAREARKYKDASVFRAGGLTCMERPCPCGKQNCNHVSYRPTQTAERLRVPGLQKVLSYGSQENVVTHYKDKVYLTGSSQENGGKERTREVDNVVIYEITRVSGDSSSSILGMALQLNPKVANMHTTFLDAYWSQLGSGKTWTCRLEPRGGWWTMDPVQAPAHALTLPLVPFSDPRLLPMRGIDVFFYMTELSGIGVVRNGVRRLWVPEIRPNLPTGEVMVQRRGFPTFAIWDTGTSNTYGSPEVGKNLSALDYDEQVDTLEFWFPNGSKIDWTFDQMIDPDGYPGHRSPTTAFHVAEGRTLPGFEDMFHGVPCLLMGARQMCSGSKGCTWKHDMDNLRLQVWRN